MRDDELTALLRSPSFELEPPGDLLEGVRRDARRVRRRHAVGTALASVAVLVAGAVVAPGLVGVLRGPDSAPAQVALAPDSRFPEASSTVYRLASLHGGEVLTFFEGRSWCTASVRLDRAKACSRTVGYDLAPFAFLVPRGSESLTVDGDGLVAGLLGKGVERVDVHLSDGTVRTAEQAQPRGFVRPVWWLSVPPSTEVAGATAHGPDGEVLGCSGRTTGASPAPGS